MKPTKAEKEATEIEKTEPKGLRKEGEITMLDLFTRIVTLEAKVDGISQRSSRTEKRFVGYLVLFGLVVSINALISIAFFIRFFFRYGL